MNRQARFPTDPFPDTTPIEQAVTEARALMRTVVNYERKAVGENPLRRSYLLAAAQDLRETAIETMRFRAEAVDALGGAL